MIEKASDKAAQHGRKIPRESSVRTSVEMQKCKCEHKKTNQIYCCAEKAFVSFGTEKGWRQTKASEIIMAMLTSSSSSIQLKSSHVSTKTRKKPALVNHQHSISISIVTMLIFDTQNIDYIVIVIMDSEPQSFYCLRIIFCIYVLHGRRLRCCCGGDCCCFFPFIQRMIFRNVCAEVIKKTAYQQLY